jgi:hypothetical protein
MKPLLVEGFAMVPPGIKFANPVIILKPERARAQFRHGEVIVNLCKRLAVLLVLCGAPLAAAGLFDFGIKGGVPFTDALEAVGNFESLFSRWTVGPVVELNLPAGLGIEFNALYRRTGYRIDNTEQTAPSWEFPLLAKYKFPGVAVRPYLAGGFVFRNIGDIPGLLENNSDGFVAAAGVRLGAVLVRISPEIRYTHWNNQPFAPGAFPAGGVISNQDQFELLVGLTF